MFLITLIVVNTVALSHILICNTWKQEYFRLKLQALSAEHLILREKSDYEDFFVPEKEYAEQVINEADDFLKTVNRVLQERFFGF